MLYLFSGVNTMLSHNITEFAVPTLCGLC